MATDDPDGYHQAIHDEGTSMDNMTTPHPCNKCWTKPEVGANYSQMGNIYSGHCYISCNRCLESVRAPIGRSVHRAHQNALTLWNGLNPLPETEGEG